MTGYFLVKEIKLMFNYERKRYSVGPILYFQKTGSESELASDVGEEGESSVHSAAEHSDSASHEAEYVNPRGVRFMPHQQHKDGKLTKTSKLIAFGTNLPETFRDEGKDAVIEHTKEPAQCNGSIILYC